MEKKEEEQKQEQNAEQAESPPFHAVAIPYGEDFTEFAHNVEKTLNENHAAGFQGELSTHPKGLLYIGRRVEQRDSPLRQMLQQMFTHNPPEEDGSAGLSRQTRLLMNAVCEGIDINKPETFTPALEKRGEFFRRYPPDVMKQGIKELEADIASHSERCSDPECNMPKLATAVAEQLKKYVALSVS
jgi:hypothetical protein